MMGRVGVRPLFRAAVLLAASAIDDGAFFVDYGIRRRRPAWIAEGVRALLHGMSRMSALLGRGLSNPPLAPRRPSEWLFLLREAVKSFKKVARTVRRARRRVSAAALRRMEAEARRMEERLVLRARRTRDEFLARWPTMWTEALEREFWQWWARRLR